MIPLIETIFRNQCHIILTQATCDHYRNLTNSRHRMAVRMNGAYYFSLGSHKGCILLRMYIKFTKCMLLINWHQSENKVELKFGMNFPGMRIIY